MARDWIFDKEIVDIFDDMVSRSVPFYPGMQKIFTDIASTFYKPNTTIYDLGCSTGTTMLNILSKINDREIKIVGIDSSEAMLNKAKEKLLNSKCKLVKADLNEEIKFEQSSIIMLNWTLQFVRPMNRNALIKNIYEALVEGGILVISEKVLARNSDLNRLYIDLYYKLKKERGYTESEILKKREELENVLIPYRVEENIELLQRNGFKNPDVFFKYMNFAGIVAVKE